MPPPAAAGGAGAPRQLALARHGQPSIAISHIDKEKIHWSLRNVDTSIANAIRRVIIAEVPTMAIDLVRMHENQSPIFDEFIAHRLGLVPLRCDDIGDVPGAREIDPRAFLFKDECDCLEGCPLCEVRFKIDVKNFRGENYTVTHFDVQLASAPRPERDQQVMPAPVAMLGKALTEHERLHKGIVITKLRHGQEFECECVATKGIGRMHAKHIPVATSVFRYQHTLSINPEQLAQLTLGQQKKIADSCPTRVFGPHTTEQDMEDFTRLEIRNPGDCIACQECTWLCREMGQRHMIDVIQESGMYHFETETAGGRDPASIVLAGIQVLGSKFRRFLQELEDLEERQQE